MELLTSQITDPILRENFRRIQDYLRVNDLFEGFIHIDLKFAEAAQSYRYYHGLGYVPQDIVRTKFIGPGEVRFNYGRFDREYIDMTVTGPCQIRALVGSVKKEKVAGNG